MSLLAAAMSKFQKHPQVIDKFFETLNSKPNAEALEATKPASIHQRKLPAEQVVWLSIGMAIFTNTSSRQVLGRPDLTINGKVVSSTASDARKRLRPKPLFYIFELLASSWSDQMTTQTHWRGMRLFGINGTCVRVPDYEENLIHFGRPGSYRSEAACPHLQVVRASDLAQRLLYFVKIGQLAVNERIMARSLIEKIPQDSLCLKDRGLEVYCNFCRLTNRLTNNYNLGQVRTATKFTAEAEKVLPGETVIATLKSSWNVRMEERGIQKELRVRVIDYKVEHHAPIQIFASLLRHRKYSGRDLAILYYKRQEIGLASDELKTNLLDGKESLRSQSVSQSVSAGCETRSVVHASDL